MRVSLSGELRIRLMDRWRVPCEYFELRQKLFTITHHHQNHHQNFLRVAPDCFSWSMHYNHATNKQMQKAMKLTWAPCHPPSQNCPKLSCTPVGMASINKDVKRRGYAPSNDNCCIELLLFSIFIVCIFLLQEHGSIQTLSNGTAAFIYILLFLPELAIIFHLKTIRK